MATPDSMLQGKGFFGSLFDFSFSSFITLRFIKIIYIIGMVVVGFLALGILFTIASRGGAGIVIGPILSAGFFLFYVIVFRLILEFIVVIFRIGENTSLMVHELQGRWIPPGPGSGAPPTGLQ